MRPNPSWQQQQVMQQGILAPDCSPGVFRLDLENPFSPGQWKVSTWAKPGTCLHCLAGTWGPEVPRNGCLAQH